MVTTPRPPRPPGAPPVYIPGMRDENLGLEGFYATPTGLVRVAFASEGEDAVLQELADRVSPRVLPLPGFARSRSVSSSRDCVPWSVAVRPSAPPCSPSAR